MHVRRACLDRLWQRRGQNDIASARFFINGRVVRCLQRGRLGEEKKALGGARRPTSRLQGETDRSAMESKLPEHLR